MHTIYLLSKIANHYPDNIALRYGTETQTYSELNVSSNALEALLKDHNIESGSRVGLFFNDPLLFINAMIAVVKLNAIYVPFDKKDSFQNIADLCQIADVSFFLHDLDFTDPILTNFSPLKIERQHLINREILLPSVQANFPLNPVLYIMFTSSTTGKAKGVLINHAGISRFINANNIIKIIPGDVILQASSISFDASSFEIWAALLNGATLVLVDKNFEFLNLGSYLSEYKINVLWLTTKLFETLLLIDSQVFEKLKYLIFGGEACTFNNIITACKSLPTVKLINGYGPTENTIFTTLHLVSLSDQEKGFIPIGLPVNETECFVLDEQLNQVAQGETGTLFVSGSGVAHSYTDKTLTDIYFINHPVLGVRLYNTNDIVRHSPDFGFQYIGRTDRQVKLNGYRIELDLIENTINQLENILHSVAVFISSKYSDELILFYSTKNKQPLEDTILKNYLEQQLPWYSIPKNIEFVEEFPFNKSNKINQKKLIENLKKNKETDSIPANEIETIWKEVLQLESISPTDNFFHIGGDSLSSLVLISEINKAFQLNLKIGYIVENPVFDNFQSKLLIKDHSQNDLVLVKEGKLDCPIFLIPTLSNGSEIYYLLAENLKTKQSIFSFNKQFDFDYTNGNYFALNTSLIEELSKSIAGYIVNSGQFKKVILSGYSLAGNIAIETSLELKKHNIDVVQIHLLDTYKLGSTVITTTSQLSVILLGLYEIILRYIASVILKGNKNKFIKLLHFLTQNEINPQQIKNIPVFLYKCLRERRKLNLVDSESLGWSSRIEQLKIIEINCDHASLLKEKVHVKDLAAKMDISIDLLLNELDFQRKEFNELSKSDLDYYLSKGWLRLRFGNHMFTDTKASFDNAYFPVKWLRYKLDASFLSKSIKKDTSFKQKKRFTPLFSDFDYEKEKDELESLYAAYRSNLDFDAYPSVYSTIHHGAADTSIFNTKIVKLYDNEKLIGVGIFDEGEISGSGILYFFDHEYRRYGIGKYLIILILEYLVANNFTYYYVGFIFIGHPKLDYKLSVEKSGIEYYDLESDKWLSYYP